MYLFLLLGASWWEKYLAPQRSAQEFIHANRTKSTVLLARVFIFITINNLYSA